MKTSDKGYVGIKDTLLPSVVKIGVPTGKTRVERDEVEAEFVCIRRKDNCGKVWAKRSQVIHVRA